MEWNTVETAIKTETDKRTEQKGVDKLGWFTSDINPEEEENKNKNKKNKNKKNKKQGNEDKNPYYETKMKTSCLKHWIQ